MSDRAAAAAIPPSVARRCRLPVQGESRRRCAPSGLDSLVHSQYARRPAARQRQLPDVEIGDVESCTSSWLILFVPLFFPAMVHADVVVCLACTLGVSFNASRIIVAT